MDQWDEEKLRTVVMSKHGNPKTTTDVSPIGDVVACLELTGTSAQIVCKYFIEAIETEKYAGVPFYFCSHC